MAKTTQRRWIEVIQERLKVTSALLQNIKAVKMLGLTDVTASIIQKLRMEEIKASTTYRKVLLSILLLCKVNAARAQSRNVADITGSQHSSQPCADSHLRRVCHHIGILEGFDLGGQPGIHLDRIDISSYGAVPIVHTGLAAGVAGFELL